MSRADPRWLLTKVFKSQIDSVAACERPSDQVNVANREVTGCADGAEQVLQIQRWNLDEALLALVEQQPESATDQFGPSAAESRTP